MKKYLIISLLLTSLMVSGCTSLFLKKITINDSVLKIKVVTSKIDMLKGLSGKKDLPQDQGMLFIYDDYEIRNFHMNNMNFPLDIIWLKDNEIVGIEHEVPLLINNEVTRVNSKSKINMVLEVNSKWAQNNDINIGDIIGLD
ncbi:DUF192 domain-containing protein [bacterium]|mgnify:CR=1 FL=1|jgi:uncharacterized protein|nr:DUF192 domain-containing protein [bacterium]MBT4121614.1 DUF192 domain-containing protein [bacterium]MBT4335123.1 DUF192 domain-containing protein [bacterium]MBT4495284.1 DUF192 domain-containing protein [bacterium]MBT4763908.1 DUF192 domain-containing protein [bacterium]